MQVRQDGDLTCFIHVYVSLDIYESVVLLSVYGCASSDLLVWLQGEAIQVLIKDVSL